MSCIYIIYIYVIPGIVKQDEMRYKLELTDD